MTNNTLTRCLMPLRTWRKNEVTPHIKQGVEIIKKIGDIASELGEKLAHAPHENYSEILEYLGRIKELLKSKEG